jgi:hypothetical protein
VILVRACVARKNFETETNGADGTIARIKIYTRLQKQKLLQNKAKQAMSATFRPSSVAAPTRESAPLSAVVSQPLNLRRRRQMLRFLLMVPDQATIGEQNNKR